MKKKLFVLIMSVLILGGMLFAAGDSEARVQEEANKWPKSPIQIFVGANAGGGIDTAARLMGKYLEKELGVSMVVTNMSGGAGSIAATNVKDSKADGYTMLVCHEALLSNKIAGITDFDHDAFTGAVGLKVYTTCLLSRDYETFDELVAAAKAKPGTVKFGTEAATNDTHIIAMMEQNLGTKIQVVDSGAIPNQVASMMGGHIDFMKAPLGLVRDYVRTGEFNLLGFFNEERHPDYPDVPTLAEKNVPFFVDKFYFAGFPKDTPSQIVDKFAAALEKVTSDPAFIEEAARIDYTAEFVAPKDIDPYFNDVINRLKGYQKIYDEVVGK